nr:hypothetical protein [Tanacetum cinerariifolium]
MAWMGRNANIKDDVSVLKLINVIHEHSSTWRWRKWRLSVVVTLRWGWSLSMKYTRNMWIDKKLSSVKKLKGLSLNLTIKILKLNASEKAKKEKDDLDGKLTGFQSASKDLDNLLESQRSDKNKEGLGYSVVPPPPAQVYPLPKKDMSWTGLPEFVDDTITDHSRPSPAIESKSDDL